MKMQQATWFSINNQTSIAEEQFYRHTTSADG